MANDELRLLAKVIEEQDLRLLKDSHIEIDHFKTPDGQMIWRAISSYYNARATSGLVPARSFIEKRYPDVPLPKREKTPLKALVEEFMTGHVRQELTLLADELTDVRDPDEALRHLRQKCDELSRQRRISEDYILSDALTQVKTRYENAKNRVGYAGIPYPWRVLNEESGGVLDGEFVVLYGRPKSMKTWVLLSCACHAYDKGCRRVLVCTREMRPDQIMDRCVCILIGAPYSAFKKGLMHLIPVPEGGTMEDRFYELIGCMKSDEETCQLESGHGKSLIVTSDRADPNGGGVQGLRQKVKDYSPDLLCVDAMYLMKDDREGKKSIKWYNQSAISQDIKDLALDTNIPIIGTNQAKRDSEEKSGKAVSNISFSDSYGMDCDMAIEIIKKSTKDKEVNELALAITASREINMTGFAINGNAASNFGCLLHKKRDEVGSVILDETGEPIMVPVVFDDYPDLKNFFKDANDPDKPTSKALNATQTKAAWQELRGRRR